MPKFKQNQTKDLPLDPKNIGYSCGGQYTYSAEGDWRWTTTQEQQGMEAQEIADASQTFDHEEHRHDDDGFGGAVGHAQAHGLIEDDNDLGAEWGKSTIADTYNAMKSGAEYGKRSVKGHDAMAEFPQVIETAKKMLDESAADPVGTRFALIQYKVEGTDPVTLKGGKVTGTMAINTIGEQAIIDYAVMLETERVMKLLSEDGLVVESPSSLEIN